MWFSLGGGALIAKDALGDDVTVKGWLDAHPAGDRKLVQGMKGDATYLIVKEDKTLEVITPRERLSQSSSETLN